MVRLALVSRSPDESEMRLAKQMGVTDFLKKVVPVAEAVRVKLALHPDGPPISPVRGLARIIRSIDAFKRVFDMVPSDYNQSQGVWQVALYIH